ncbi:MAG: flagellar export protein FliJ [Nevskia sp.]|nr:flagellar export protein FliJ [Nevskia sp.]
MNSKPTLSKRLDPIHRLAQNREDEAARRLAESQQALARQEVQLQEMERYLNEYGAGTPSAPIAPALLANREAFMRQLAEALRWQAGAVADARERLESARQQWLGRHRDTDVLEHLIERSQGSERRTQERRAQRELDEFAARLPLNRATG